MLWYIREASVATYVTNLPMVWPLLREVLPFLKSPESSIKKYSTPTYQTGALGSKLTKRRTNGQDDLGDVTKSAKSLTGRETIDEVNEFELQDISEREKAHGDNLHMKEIKEREKAHTGDIQVVTTFTVER